MELKEYNLPEWVWLDSYTHLGDDLKGREVLLHTPTMSIVEFICLEEVDFLPNEGTPTLKFKIDNERYIAVYYKGQHDPIDTLNKAIAFYKKDVDWMDKEMIDNN